MLLLPARIELETLCHLTVYNNTLSESVLQCQENLEDKSRTLQEAEMEDLPSTIRNSEVHVCVLDLCGDLPSTIHNSEVHVCVLAMALVAWARRNRTLLRTSIQE